MNPFTQHHPRFGCLLMTCVLAMSAYPLGLHAQALQPRTCDAWNTARKANLSSAVQREWLFGYLNGWRDAQLAFKGTDVFQSLPAVEVLIDRANVFCESNPQSAVDQSITAVLRAITDP